MMSKEHHHVEGLFGPLSGVTVTHPDDTVMLIGSAATLEEMEKKVLEAIRKWQAAGE